MYTKLFSSIIHSSVWSKDTETRILWITMLAMMDREGFVYASVTGLSHAAHVPVSKVREILADFMAPDPESSDMTREPEREGRRIEVTDGGWRVLNATHYRDLKDAEERRERWRKAKQQSRGARVAKRLAATPVGASATLEEAFADWWMLYPRKVKKPAALLAWARLKPSEREAALAGLKTFAFSPDVAFIPHPGTWLRQRRWEDEPDRAIPAAGAKAPHQSSLSVRSLTDLRGVKQPGGDEPGVTKPDKDEEW